MLPYSPVFIVLSALLLTGCAAQPVEPPAPPPPVVSKPPVVDKKTQVIEQLLTRGDMALAQQRFSEPTSGNAYDIYKAVLILDPGNVRAIDGLKKDADGYVGLVQENLRGKHFDTALKQAQKGLVMFPTNSSLKVLEADVRKARAAYKLPAPRMAVAGPNQILLPADALKAQSPEVEAQLQAIAARVVASNESVVIYARSDSEGRWIYKVMKKAAGDYRIRGDIKIAANPSDRKSVV